MSNHEFNSTESVNEVVNEAIAGNVQRRDFLRRVVLLGLTSSAAYKLLDATTAQAQTTSARKITTMALGEEGNPPASQSPSPSPPTTLPQKNVTTFAVGEESTGKPVTQPNGENAGRPTTLAVGEENGGQPTTMAVGEETTRPPTTMAQGEEQPYCPTPQPTTKAVGEEGNTQIRPTTRRVGEENQVSTRAVGEESVGRPTPTTTAWGEESNTVPAPNPRPRPKATTQAVGEEGSSTPQFKLPADIMNRVPFQWNGFRRW